jgi:hypothetical protein
MAEVELRALEIAPDLFAGWPGKMPKTPPDEGLFQEVEAQTSALQSARR